MGRVIPTLDPLGCGNGNSQSASAVGQCTLSLLLSPSWPSMSPLHPLHHASTSKVRNFSFYAHITSLWLLAKHLSSWRPKSMPCDRHCERERAQSPIGTSLILFRHHLQANWALFITHPFQQSREPCLMPVMSGVTSLLLLLFICSSLPPLVRGPGPPRNSTEQRRRATRDGAAENGWVFVEPPSAATKALPALPRQHVNAIRDWGNLCPI